jgi:hypothetical protein
MGPWVADGPGCRRRPRRGVRVSVHPPTRPEMVGGASFGWEPGNGPTMPRWHSASLRLPRPVHPIRKVSTNDSWSDIGRVQRCGHFRLRALLGAAREAADLARLARARFKGSRDNSAGNGSLMRTAPVALAHLGDDEELSASARAISDLAHGDCLTGKACVRWRVTIERAVRDERLVGIREVWLFCRRFLATGASWIGEAESQPAPLLSRCHMGTDEGAAVGEHHQIWLVHSPIRESTRIWSSFCRIWWNESPTGETRENPLHPLCQGVRGENRTRTLAAASPRGLGVSRKDASERAAPVASRPPEPSFLEAARSHLANSRG